MSNINWLLNCIAFAVNICISYINTKKFGQVYSASEHRGKTIQNNKKSPQSIKTISNILDQKKNVRNIFKICCLNIKCNLCRCDSKKIFQLGHTSHGSFLWTVYWCTSHNIGDEWQGETNISKKSRKRLDSGLSEWGSFKEKVRTKR